MNRARPIPEPSGGGWYIIPSSDTFTSDLIERMEPHCRIPLEHDDTSRITPWDRIRNEVRRSLFLAVLGELRAK